MKSINNTNISEKGKNEITFAGYYESIPTYPKRNFIKEVCKRCEVSRQTVENWATGRSKPQKRSHYIILSELTGIAPEKLFES